ncbi:MAG: CAP domain-containing protein [Myxococcota bacterium]
MKKFVGIVVGVVVLATGCGDDTLLGNDRMGGTGGVTGGGGDQCGGVSAEAAALDTEEQRFLDLLNQHRAANGIAPVTACTSMSRSAQAHSEDMRDQDYFDHTGLNGSSPGSRACDACFESCQSTGFGENIAAGNAGADATFDQWVNSPGHNANMLGENYVVVGLGRATGGGTYGVYWTNVFATGTDASCN